MRNQNESVGEGPSPMNQEDCIKYLCDRKSHGRASSETMLCNRVANDNKGKVVSSEESQKE